MVCWTSTKVPVSTLYSDYYYNYFIFIRRSFVNNLDVDKNNRGQVRHKENREYHHHLSLSPSLLLILFMHTSQILVDEYLKLPSLSNVYAIGDCASVIGNDMPCTAQVGFINIIIIIFIIILFRLQRNKVVI